MYIWKRWLQRLSLREGKSAQQIWIHICFQTGAYHIKELQSRAFEKGKSLQQSPIFEQKIPQWRILVLIGLLSKACKHACVNASMWGISRLGVYKHNLLSGRTSHQRKIPSSPLSGGSHNRGHGLHENR